MGRSEPGWEPTGRRQKGLFGGEWAKSRDETRVRASLSVGTATLMRECTWGWHDDER